VTTYIDKPAWLYIKDRRVLFTLSKGKDKYYLPGGKPEAGESEQDCLLREIKEELTVDLIPATVARVGQFEAQAHGKSGDVTVRMTCFSADYQGTLQASSEIAEIAWLKHEDRFKCAPVDIVILDWLKAKGQID
jgi:8-oxo-dGTP pyrophosphatase MutT (NUDIX family)